MPTRGPPSFLDEALEMLLEADRMHQQFFRFAVGRPEPAWEPPVDIVESERALVIRVALPGVPRDAVQVRSDGRSLHVVGVRPLGAGRGEKIHRVEIPHGRFERRIDLPPGRYELVRRELVDGCLVLELTRLA